MHFIKCKLKKLPNDFIYNALLKNQNNKCNKLSFKFK